MLRRKPIVGQDAFLATIELSIHCCFESITQIKPSQQVAGLLNVKTSRCSTLSTASSPNRRICPPIGKTLISFPSARKDVESDRIRIG